MEKAKRTKSHTDAAFQNFLELFRTFLHLRYENIRQDVSGYLNIPHLLLVLLLHYKRK